MALQCSHAFSLELAIEAWGIITVNLAVHVPELDMLTSQWLCRAELDAQCIDILVGANTQLCETISEHTFSSCLLSFQVSGAGGSRRRVGHSIETQMRIYRSRSCTGIPQPRSRPQSFGLSPCIRSRGCQLRVLVAEKDVQDPSLPMASLDANAQILVVQSDHGLQMTTPVEEVSASQLVASGHTNAALVAEAGNA